jgi:dipeptidyl aminopeptidase/acylaminoacyl peptidase
MMGEQYDWWVIPLDGGPAVKTGAGGITQGRRLPGAWMGDRVIYSASSGDSTGLWTIAISLSDWKASGPPRRLTTGTAVEDEASVSASGQVVFTSLASNVNIWCLPLKADRGTVEGEFRRLTQGPASKVDISVSPDGSKVAFVEGKRYAGKLKVRNLETGKETVLASDPQRPTYPSFSPDGSKVVYSVDTSEDRPPELYVVPARGGLAEKTCDGCGNVPVFAPDGTMIAYDWEQPRRIKLFEIAARRTITIFEHQKFSVVQPQFCPSGRWVAFTSVIQPDRTRIIVAPFRGAAPIPEAEWISVTDGSAFDIRARWSPNGNLLYFISDRDGFQCIWGQRLDPGSKRPAGEPFVVYHMHNPQHSAAAIPDLGMGVGRDKLMLNVVERTGNIWMAEFKP